MKRSPRSSRVYLQDIAGAIERIDEYASKGEHEFFRNGLLQDGIIRQLSIIGEASAKLPTAFRATEPHIPWNKIIGMRNILVHDYSETDLPTIWDTVQTNLPVLRTAVQSMLAGLPSTEAA